MTDRVDVVIAGGGLNGPALGLALAGAGLTVAVVDARPARERAGEAFDGRAYALALASQRLLAALGVWPALAAEAQPILRVEAVQARPGEAPGWLGLGFDAAELEEGPLGFMVEDRHLYRALLEAMEAAPGLTHLPGTSVRGVEAGPAGVTVTLDGGRIGARLLVGADGRGSFVARDAGIRRTGWDYGQTALVTALSHELPHGGTARQVFLPGGPLAILPLTGNRSSIVWSLPRREAEALRAQPDAAFLDALRPAFGPQLGAIALAGPRFDYPLSLSLAERYIAPRRALIGDAAHGVHPIAGQGLNLGLRDVAALAECVVEARRRGEDFGSDLVLERYQGWRRFDATLLAAGMDGVNRLFSNGNPLLRLARGLGMGAVQAVPALRRGFMRQAAGLSLDPMPRLLAGQPL
ncbi:2-octaprenyl-6-methoxyphenyl hydroxylase [Paracoccus sp. S-4012]|uniref:UbiH/UbiF/VisC/COQ6 family ubiquinone biosynthesis hydroxylase n=1 Tax=Paracoccus sp. S-4012 TaxID=2665648 RepID=UPI0012AFD468|nr:UbiH/UbiF/VisC/COQ6 family ubiquinone biosynthesis hydroxylase [Paracoccus sp. S-4012]MRX49731.1 2-octaprenyl-6-methoxyphenyl hydroxylase [Paracoccus sp. S-4012]